MPPADLRALLEKATPKHPHICRRRYEHGGGRMYSHADPDNREGGRDLILDVYSEGAREFYFAVADALPGLLDEIERLKGFVDEDERLVEQIRESLPEYMCDADGNHANEIERVEFAGRDLAAKDAEIASLRRELAEARASRDEIQDRKIENDVYASDERERLESKADRAVARAEKAERRVEALEYAISRIADRVNLPRAQGKQPDYDKIAGVCTRAIRRLRRGGE